MRINFRDLQAGLRNSPRKRWLGADQSSGKRRAGVAGFLTLCFEVSINRIG